MLLTLLLIVGQILSPRETGYTFVKLGVGVRPVAMGGAFSAMSDDGHAVFWNPSGLGIADKYHIIGMAMNHLTYFHYYNLTSALPIGSNDAVGLGLSYFGATDVEYSERGDELGEFTNADMLLNIGYGRSFGKHKTISFGAAIKVVRGQLYDYSSYGVLGDVGLLWNPWKYIYLGTVLKNLGTRRRYIEMWEDPPINFRQGAAVKIPVRENQLAMSVDYSAGYYKSTIAVGGEVLIRDPKLLGYSEQRKISGFRIMAGYHSGYGEGTFSGFSMGFSLELAVSKGLYVDIGALLLSYGYLGSSERIALGLNYVPTRGRANKQNSQSGRSRS